MNEERMLEQIGQVKEEFIEEAAPNGLLEGQKIKTVSKKASVYRFARWGALAACLCLVVGLSVKALQPKDEINMDTSINNSTEEEYNFNANTSMDDFVNHDTTTADTEALYIGDEGFPDWGITLSVKNVTPSGLTLVVTQKGGNPTGSLDTGEAYYLITLVDGTWKTVEELPLPEGVDGRGFNSLAYLIPRGETREFDIDWAWIYGELPNGTYRLIKEFMDFRETGNYDTFNYWIEFEIK